MKAVGLMAGGVVLVLLLFLSILFYRSYDSQNPYLAAVELVAEEEHITGGTLDGNLLRTIYLLQRGSISESTEEIAECIRQNFLVFDTRHILIPAASPDDETDSSAADNTADSGATSSEPEMIEVEIIITRFMNQEEILEKLRGYPFFFSAQQMQIIELYPVVTGNGADTSLHGPYPRPCDGYVSSPWGMREDPLKPGTFRKHAGVDIRGQWHQAVYSIADGTVVKTNLASSPYGNFILIRHDGMPEGTFYSLYAHLSKILVSQGDEVAQGEQIGNEGGEPGKDHNPGDSIGHHLHLEIRLSTKPKSDVNPAGYIS